MSYWKQTPQTEAFDKSSSIIAVLYLEHFRNRIAENIYRIFTPMYTHIHEQAHTSQGSQCKFQMILAIPGDWGIAKPTKKKNSDLLQKSSRYWALLQKKLQ